MVMRNEVTSAMNDHQIRAAFHRRRLLRHHRDPHTLVLDELGLQHGKCRADIALVNGHLVGIEIKSDVDSLDRLSAQVVSYSAVFDRISLVLTHRHLEAAVRLVPEWWGLVLAKQGPRGGIDFTTIRRAESNTGVDDFSVAQLLWREEAKDILLELGMEERELRGNRTALYEQLLGRLSSRELRGRVRQTLKCRSEWRDHERPSPSDG